MKKNVILSVLLVLVMLMGSTAFASERENVPFASNQHVLFYLQDAPFGSPKSIHDLEYDRINEHLYVILKPGDDFQAQFTLEQEPVGNQHVYALTGEGEEVEEPAYPLLLGYQRKGIEFEANQTWSLEFPIEVNAEEEQEEQSSVWLYNFEDEIVKPNKSFYAKGFAIQGDHVIYYLDCDEEYTFFEGATEITDDGIIRSVNVDSDNAIGGELEYIKAYDLSLDGRELIFAGSIEYDNDGSEYEKNYLVRYDLENREVIAQFLISDFPVVDDYYSEVYDLYATEDYIVVLYKNAGEMKGYIDRYTYEGEKIDGVETNYCVKKMTQGPDGSTIYIQKRYPDEENQERKEFSALEVIQINWNGEGGLSQNNGPRPVIQERTRAGYTVARFTDHQFGLLRVEEPETGIVDYSAPIRSNEKLVKLQIPYGDIQAKLESGARNLMVKYQGQTLTFPMELFACDEMLAAMPCQSDATIEIIMHTDEAGNVTFEVQLFVVEQVNGMTKVVHRKTIQ
jgi:hypothetical protein